ncbi:hypothetical protein BSQ37_03210 [Pediococcus damnosus]|nr:hypothetical protein BSQ38_07340 [Pediococcus damnosus]PIO84999.1 hypothetical protein BSQ37_03210 [Pediococcus damnosus]
MTIEFHGYRPYYRERYKNNQHGVHEKEESNMIKAEWKYIKTHSFVMIVLAVLILIPSLYGVIFLSSMWDPYGKIKDLPVAVVNEDQPVNYQNNKLAVGKQLKSNLEKSNALDFHFPSKKNAEKGLHSGKYYMVMTIPHGFSKNATTLLNNSPKKMKLNYETSAGHSFIAAKFSESAAKSMQDTVSNKVTKIYAQTMFQEVGQMGTGMGKAAKGSKKLTQGAEKLATADGEISGNLQKLASSTLTFQSGAQKVSQGIGQYVGGVSEVNTNEQKVNNGIQQLSTSVAPLATGVTKLDNGAQTVNTGVGQYTGAVSQLNTGATSLTGGLQTASNGVDSLSSATGKLANGENQINSATGELQSGSAEITANLNKLSSGISGQNTNLNEVKSGLTQLKGQMNKLSGQTTSASSQAAMTQVKQQMATLQSDVSSMDKSQTQSSSNNNVQQKVAAAADAQHLTAAQKKAVVDAAAGSNATSNNSSSTAKLSKDLQGLSTELNTLSTQQSSLKGIKSQVSSVDQVSDGAIAAINSFQKVGTQVGALGTASQKVTNGLDKVSTNSQKINSGLNEVQNKLPELNSGLTQLTNGSDKLSNGLNQLNSKSGTLSSGTSQLANGMASMDAKIPTLTNGVTTLSKGSNQLASGTATLASKGGQLQSGMNQLGSGASQISSGAGKLATGSKQLGTGINSVKNGNNKLTGSLQSASDKVSDIKPNQKTYNQFAKPVSAHHKDHDKVPNNGTGMAPYMMTVALFVGALTLNLMYDTYTPRRFPRSGTSWWASKMSVLGVASVLESTLMYVLLLVVDHMAPLQATKTYGVLLLIGLAFVALVTWANLFFGRIGAFFTLIFLILQLSGSAGTYPIQLSNGFFEAIHPYLPMTYAIHALRETLMIGGSVRNDVLVLLGIAIVFNILIIWFFSIRRGRLKTIDFDDPKQVAGTQSKLAAKMAEQED